MQSVLTPMQSMLTPMQSMLTLNVCKCLTNPADNRILVSSPTIQVAELLELDQHRPLADFTAQYKAVIVDGSGETLEVVLPSDFILSEMQPARGLMAGSILRVTHMLRLPHGSQHIILICSGTIVHPAQEAAAAAAAAASSEQLVITDLDEEIRRLTALLEERLPETPHVSAETMNGFLALMKVVGEATQESMRSRSPSVGAAQG